MPDLPAWEFEALKESIRQHSVIVPIVKDEHGTTIDGHHRERACRELKIKDIPTITLAGLTDEHSGKGRRTEPEPHSPRWASMLPVRQLM